MFRKCKPISLEKFPKDQITTDKTNCLAFALGIKKPKRRKNQYSLLIAKEPIEKLFLKKVKELGFNPKQFRSIRRIEEEKEKGYIIRLYGFVPEETLDDGIKYDFHVIRREPNGKWVHKPGFFFEPREILDDDWNLIFDKFGNRFISFALDA